MMKIVEVKLDAVKPYARNQKKHPPEQVKNIATSIKKYGFVQPVVLDMNNEIIIGHGRILAAKQLELETIPCVYAENLTEEQIRELRIIDNKLNESEWEWDFLKKDLQELDFRDFDIDFGLDTNEESKEVVEDEPPEIDELGEPTAKPGDIWQLGRHRLMCGDSTKQDDVQKLTGGVKVDMVFTDPPYGMKKECDGVLNDNLNFDDLLSFNKKWIPLSFDALKDNGSWYCWGIDEPLMDIYSEILKPMKKQKGQDKLTFRNLITWDKGHGEGQLSPKHRMYATADEKCLFIMMGRQTYGETKDDYWDGFEPIRTSLIALKDSLHMSIEEVIRYAGASTCSHWFAVSQWEFPSAERYQKFCDNCLKQERISREEYDRIREEWYKIRAYFDNTHDNMNSVWHFTRTGADERKDTGGHATPKPIALCARAIKSSSREDECVLDVFGGSGSTLIACEQLNRRCFMMELDPKYVDVIIQRWENLTGKKAVLLNDLEEDKVETDNH